jgi:hypothetical protein
MSSFDIKERIKRHCSEHNRVVNLLVCEQCEYYGGKDSLFTRSSCLHPITQKIIYDAIEEFKKLHKDCSKCISPSIMKERDVNPCLYCGMDWKYYLTQEGETNKKIL